VVILSVLDVVSAHYFDFPEVGIFFPLDQNSLNRTQGRGETYIQKVYFLQELLFVVFEFAYHIEVNNWREKISRFARLRQVG
jgi:hypothetical protein